jgi:hypothetical protein
MMQRIKQEEHEGEESVGDLSQVITSYFNKIQVKRRHFYARALWFS